MTRPLTSRCSRSPRAVSAPARTWPSAPRRCGASAASTRPPAPGLRPGAATTCTASSASSPRGTGCTTRPYALVWHHHRETWAGPGDPGVRLRRRPHRLSHRRPGQPARAAARVPRPAAARSRARPHASPRTATPTARGGAPGARGQPDPSMAAPAVAAASAGGWWPGPLGYLRARRRAWSSRARGTKGDDAMRGAGARTAQAIPVLLYHAVMDDPPDWIAEFTVTPREFASQLDASWPAAAPRSPSARSPTISPGRAPLPARPVLLTFDDGFADLPGPTAEALAARGLPATAYLTTGAITPGRPQSAAARPDDDPDRGATAGGVRHGDRRPHRHPRPARHPASRALRARTAATPRPCWRTPSAIR